MPKPRKADDITPNRIERAMVICARVIELDGEKYLPLFERLEKELDLLKREDEALARARAFLEANHSRFPEVKLQRADVRPGDHAMTVRKSDNLLRGDRTPAYVGRGTGAAELQISPDTWDQWVKDGVLPPPCTAFPEGTPRWRWEDVDRKLSGNASPTSGFEAAMAGALNFGKHVRKKRRRLSHDSII